MDYKKLFGYRTHLMGLAILWVVFFHMQVTVPGRAVEFIKKIGYGGVDIFFLLSGIGVYFSLKKNSVEAFYVRRLKRIMPAYLPIVIIVFVLYNIPRFMGLSMGQIFNWAKQIIGNVFMLGWINKVEGQFNWYVQALIWFYILSPLLITIVRKTENSNWKKWILWAVLLVIQIPFMGTVTLMASSRILVFVLGIYIALLYDSGKVIGVKKVLLYLGMVIGFGILYYFSYYKADWLFAYGMFWLPFVLVVPGLCVLLADGFAELDKNRYTAYLNKGIACIGEASFEIYLVHITVFDFILKPLGVVESGTWILMSVLCVMAGMLYKQMVSKIMSYLK